MRSGASGESAGKTATSESSEAGVDKFCSVANPALNPAMGPPNGGSSSVLCIPRGMRSSGAVIAIHGTEPIVRFTHVSPYSRRVFPLIVKWGFETPLRRLARPPPKKRTPLIVASVDTGELFS